MVFKYIYMVTGNEALKAVTKVIQLMGSSDISWVDAVGQIVNKLCLPRYHKLLYKCSKPRYVGDHAGYYHAMWPVLANDDKERFIGELRTCFGESILHAKILTVSGVITRRAEAPRYS